MYLSIWNRWVECIKWNCCTENAEDAHHIDVVSVYIYDANGECICWGYLWGVDSNTSHPKTRGCTLSCNWLNDRDCRDDFSPLLNFYYMTDRIRTILSDINIQYVKPFPGQGVEKLWLEANYNWSFKKSLKDNLIHLIGCQPLIMNNYSTPDRGVTLPTDLHNQILEYRYRSMVCKTFMSSNYDFSDVKGIKSIIDLDHEKQLPDVFTRFFIQDADIRVHSNEMYNIDFTMQQDIIDRYNLL